MSIIAGYDVRGEGAALTETVSETGVRLELAPAVPADGDRPALVVCVAGDDTGAFDAAVREDGSVMDVRELGDVGEARLYAMELAGDADLVPGSRWTKRGADRLRAATEDGWWHAIVRFADRETFSSYRSSLAAEDVEFHLAALYEDGSSAHTGVDLTGPQRETLELAYESGYFDVPRQTTTTALADQLGVSDQAVSERLRRGHARLVERVVGGNNGA